jgi:glycosyltransferase involved in cell wall biosynthesis
MQSGKRPSSAHTSSDKAAEFVTKILDSEITAPARATSTNSGTEENLPNSYMESQLITVSYLRVRILHYCCPVINTGETPLVSVVIPVFNGMAYVQETVASVLSQTYPHVELVVVDGGSTDGSVDWVKQLPESVIKDFLPAGSGAAANWTRCCQLAHGRFVKLLCQDDVIYPTAIADQVSDFMNYPNAKIAFAQRDIIGPVGQILSRSRGCQGMPNGLIDGKEALLIGYRSGTNVYGEPEAVMFDQEAMSTELPWDDTHPFLLDMFFYSKILRNHPAVVRREAIGAFRISSSSWSTRLVVEQRKQFRAWQKQAAMYSGNARTQDHILAFFNNEKTTLLRRAAYLWLTLKGSMD